MPAIGFTPVVEATTTALPPDFCIARMAVANVRKAPSRLTSITLRQSAKSSSAIFPPEPIPALTTAWSSVSTLPSISAHSFGSATLPIKVSIVQSGYSSPRPSASIPLASMSLRISRAAPRAASPFAHAAPMPDPAPVTSAVRPPKS